MHPPKVLWSSFACCRRRVLLLVAVSFLALPAAVLGNQQAVTYHASVSHEAGTCRLPSRTTYRIECGGQVVALDEKENLGLATCEYMIDNNGASAYLRCVERAFSDENRRPNGVVFQCVGTTDADWAAAVTIEAVNGGFDCSATSYGYEFIVVALHVNAVCDWLTPTAVIEEPVDIVCRGDSQPDQFDPTCAATTGCEGNACLNDEIAMPKMGVQVSLPAAIQSECLQDPPTFVSKLPVTSLGSTRQATYRVTSTLDSGSTDAVTDPGQLCAVKSPNVIRISCGTDTAGGGGGAGGADTNGVAARGLVTFLTGAGTALPDSQAAAAGCVRVDDSAFVCTSDVSQQAGDLSGTVLVGCIGSTQQQLALSVDWDPEYMTCNAGSGVYPVAGHVSYGLESFQICPESFPPVHPFPFGDVADLVAPDCFPVTSTTYDSDHSTEFPVIWEACEAHAWTCLNQPGLCDGDNNGRLELPPIRSSFRPEHLEPGCFFDPVLTVAGATTTNGGPAPTMTNGGPAPTPTASPPTNGGPSTPADDSPPTGSGPTRSTTNGDSSQNERTSTDAGANTEPSSPSAAVSAWTRSVKGWSAWLVVSLAVFVPMVVVAAA